MLDDNLRVLTRRLNDLEIELSDKNDKLRTLEKQHTEIKTAYDCIYDEQTLIRLDAEKEMRARIDAKEQENRRVREETQSLKHKHDSEIETLKAQNKHDLE